MYKIVQIRRGLKEDLPLLQDGELGYCTDTKEFYIGAGGANLLLNIQANWTQSNNEALDYIKNKPTIPSIPSIMTTTEGNAGTATTQRTINAANLKTIILNHSPAGARPASDVSTWAKASTKPTYTASEVGLGNVDNTSDLDKPISTAQQVALEDKVDKVAGKELSTNDYTTTEKNKLSGIEAGAEVNVQSDWAQETTTADDYIKNKPVLATVATSGSYLDLSNKPELTDEFGDLIETDPLFSASPAAGIVAEDITNWNAAEANVQSDWAQSDDTADDYIKNKPTIPDDISHLTDSTSLIPSKLSDLTNDIIITESQISDLGTYATTTDVPIKFWTGTQNQYNTLTKDANTLYIIVG